MPAWKQRIADQVAKLAPQYAIDARLALAVIAVESNFEPTARSAKGALGVWRQLLFPVTSTKIAARYASAVSLAARVFDFAPAASAR